MGLRTREVIKEKGMTIRTLADRMGINRVGLSNHINGSPSVTILEETAIVLEVPIQELLEKEPNRNINGYTEIGTEIFKITSPQDMKNTTSRFNSTE